MLIQMLYTSTCWLCFAHCACTLFCVFGTLLLLCKHRVSIGFRCPCQLSLYNDAVFVVSLWRRNGLDKWLDFWRKISPGEASPGWWTWRVWPCTRSRPQQHLKCREVYGLVQLWNLVQKLHGSEEDSNPGPSACYPWTLSTQPSELLDEKPCKRPAAFPLLMELNF